MSSSPAVEELDKSWESCCSLVADASDATTCSGSVLATLSSIPKLIVLSSVDKASVVSVTSSDLPLLDSSNVTSLDTTTLCQSLSHNLYALELSAYPGTWPPMHEHPVSECCVLVIYTNILNRKHANDRRWAQISPTSDTVSFWLEWHVK